jgi:hypothetical protein
MITLINNIKNTMKKLFEKLTSFVRGALGLAFDQFRTHAEVAVKMTANIKKIVESPIGDTIVTLIPGDIDNKILAKLRQVLPQVLERMLILSNIVKENDTNTDVIESIISHLKNLHPEARVSFWVLFSAELNRALSDGKIEMAEAFVLSQMVYLEIKKDKK